VHLAHVAVARSLEVAAEAPPRLRRAVRRLAPAARVSVLAAWQLGGDRIASAGSLIALAAETRPSAVLVESAAGLATACRDGAARSFRSDPAFILEMMDNLALAALTVASGFGGEGLVVGHAPGQLAAALATVAERAAAGAEVVLLAGREADASDGAPLGIALGFAPTGPGPTLGVVRCAPVEDVPPGGPSARAPDLLLAWSREVARLPAGRHRTVLREPGMTTVLEIGRTPR
jgi:hypothetical protein